ncbi:MAG: WecB/TagA/CpsF family glycosyltransferase [Candidatus Gastranaerophilales bacterium]|nr:WecB/TagA/CpsF family glycosyltransferase [Candidatus Gastranaerophilales bacterium]
MTNFNKKTNILGYPVDIINKNDAVDLICRYIEQKKSAHVVTINPEMIFQANKNKQTENILKSAELVIPDGIGVVLSLKTKGINVKQVAGIEFSESLIQKCEENGYKTGFLGASEDIVNAAADEMLKKYSKLNISFIHDGYFNEEKETEIIEKLKTVNIQVLFVALGVPKQELWISSHRQDFPQTIMVGVGGSFDVWSKKIKRAPVFFRKFGLEWFYRLICQPSRFKRMFPTLPLFLVKALLDRENTGKILR